MQKKEFTWVAVYKNGRRFSEYNADGSANLYKDIDRDQLHQMLILDRATQEVALLVHASDPQRVIVRRRHEQLGGTDKPHMTVWIVGCQSTKNGRNMQTINAIFPDGHIETADRFMEGHEWLYPPMYFPDGAQRGIPAVMDGINHPIDAGERWDFTLDELNHVPKC